MEKVNDSWDWASIDWFLPGTFSNFSFQHPELLYLLALIPLTWLVRWLLSLRRTNKLPIALPKNAPSNPLARIFGLIPNLLATLFFAFFLIALARPQITNERVEQWSEGIDIVLVIDISESMRIEDFRPNRLEAAKDVARNFIAGRNQDRIGLVVFSGDAYSLSPLTTDYDLLNRFIRDIDFDLIKSRGTAIGSALAVATNRMRDAEETAETRSGEPAEKSKVMVLLSDGDNTAGNIDPITAAKLAHAYDIKMYTIAIGREGRVPLGKNFWGDTQYVENRIDETTLRTIAEIGEGQFYRVSNKSALQEVFAEIDQYERAEIKENRYRETSDYYMVYLSWGIVFFLTWLLVKSTFISNGTID